VTGAVIGSGELVLTTSLGAVAGWGLLWFMLLSCWCKSLVQAEIARYTIISGDTYLRALNRVPGKIWRITWPIWLSMFATIPGIVGLGGIIGGGGEALSFLTSLINRAIDPTAALTLGPAWCTGIIAVTSSIILSMGNYKWLERVMIVLVFTFTLTTLICSIAMQFTEYRTTSADLLTGMTPDFSIFTLVIASIALSAYGYTGTTSGDISAYTYWCIEKGYPSFIGSDRSNPNWESHARGWIKVLYTDVILALVILSFATIPYYILGAGVLHKMGLEPDTAKETISVLSNIFTQTLGPWAVWVFSIGAFFILFSTVLSGVGGGGRFIPDYFIEMKLFDRSDVHIRKAITRWYVGALPIIAFLIYLPSLDFVFLIKIGALTSALFLPIQSGVTIWLHSKKLDPRIRPGMPVRIALWVIFVLESLMALLVVRYVFWPVFIKALGISSGLEG
jgi:Mn2+/Fe2+ NRAMP family transporter